MREFDKYEMFKSKCNVCGSKNKVYTELKSMTDRFIGYTLKCCNCGNFSQFILDHRSNGRIFNETQKKGIQRCIQVSYCSKKDCPLYGTCKVKQNDTDFPKDQKQMCDSPSEDSSITVQVLNAPKFL